MEGYCRTAGLKEISAEAAPARELLASDVGLSGSLHDVGSRMFTRVAVPAIRVHLVPQAYRRMCQMVNMAVVPQDAYCYRFSVAFLASDSAHLAGASVHTDSTAPCLKKAS